MKPDTDRLKALYLQHLALRNISPLTMRQTDLALRVFIAFLEGRRLAGPRSVERHHFEDYKAYLSDYKSMRGQPLTVHTIRDRLFIVQRWFSFLRKRGHLKIDPISTVQAPRFTRRLPRGVMRPDEIRRVMEQPKLESVTGYRDRTMMEVLYATGARAKEICAIRLPDVDLKKKVIRIREGKGNRERFVPLTTSACRFIERYLRETRPELTVVMRPAGHNWKAQAALGGDHLFLSMYAGPIKPQWLNAMMRRYLFTARIDRRVSPVHGFRHSVATHLIGNGMDVRYVQAFLGHTNIDSTQIYTHVERETLKRELASHHPRALGRRKFIGFKEACHVAHR